MLQLENRHWTIIQSILSKYPYKFYAYGSRVKGNARRLSDLDLCYFENIPDSVVFQIKDEFTESNLPFLVELVAWKNMRPIFQQAIQSDLTLICPYPAKTISLQPTKK
ncbi:MAG: nucleotidyltransferase domain-containing protein [Candidatus Moeniiplasma glomeromycotorum]|nr:nucleotidyltransferase domain-containing protein [Candidatus Moeniiplasma glomeromycotorum]MCE8167524.1 nucleotidyltransferase domain-containing protein [Candidatus Moeniiplasma glomeromycotorum]